jgi:TolB-like protein
VELGPVDPHAMQNDCELARNRDLGLAEPVALGEPKALARIAIPSDPLYKSRLGWIAGMVQERPDRVERRLSAILAADVAGYSRLMHKDEEATHAKLATLLANGVKPAIADHGGRVVNNDPEQDYFADGVTTDLTTDIAQIPGAFVIGRGTAFTYKNKQVDLKTLGKELGIRSAVQGAVQRAGGQVRMNVSLSDLSTGRDVWSDRFDGDRTNLAALQEQVTARLARSLNVQLTQAESRRGQMDQSTNPDAVDFNMRGWAKLYEPRTKLTYAQANNLFDSALRLDPDNIDAMLGKAFCIASVVINGWSTSVVEDKKAAIKLIDQVLAKRPATANAHIAKGSILQHGNPEGALPEFDELWKSTVIRPSRMHPRESQLLRRDARAKRFPPFRSLCA